MPSSALLRPLALVATVGLLAGSARRSDPVGVYAVVDKVVLEPDATNPKFIQIWGVFALSDGRSGNGYNPAQRGFLYYAVNEKNRTATLAEWSDLEAVAGTEKPIGFGARYDQNGNGRVRRAGETLNPNPDPYPLGVGVVKMPAMWTQPGTERELAAVPMPLTPADGAVVPAGPIRLVTRNTRLAKVQYVFQLVAPGSQRVHSDPIAAGDAQTAWTPPMQLRSGETYTWLVWVTDGTWRGQAASVQFRAGQ